MSAGSVAFLLVAGVLAGLVGTAGGIASLVSYPALLLVGIGPYAANVTNAVALVTPGAGSALNSRVELADQRPRLRAWAPSAVLGGIGGAVLLLVTPHSLFDWIVPFLVASASLLLLAQPAISRRHAGLRVRPTRLWLLAAVGAISLYSGYFGAGAGILVLATLLLLTEPDLARANALKNVLLMIADTVPAVIFALFGPVQWAAALALGAGALAGGIAGPAIMRRMPRRLMRAAIGGCGLALTGWLLVRAAGH